MPRRPTPEQLRAREQRLVEQINATNRARADLAAKSGPAEAIRGRQLRMTRKLERLREQLARVHEQMRGS